MLEVAYVLIASFKNYFAFYKEDYIKISLLKINTKEHSSNRKYDNNRYKYQKTKR